MSGVTRRQAERGFSLLDLLVSISVISLLIAMLMPTLKAVRETTKRVACGSNVRQLGIGIAMWSHDHHDQIPPTIFVQYDYYGNPNHAFENMIWLYVTPDMKGVKTKHWDGLGHLYGSEYLLAPEVFYCPAHAGNRPFERYADDFGRHTNEVVGNYQYRGVGPGPTGGTTDLSKIDPNTTALVADGLRIQSDFNHQVGANVLRADLSIHWFHDPDRTVVTALPILDSAADRAKVLDAWAILDKAIGINGNN